MTKLLLGKCGYYCGYCPTFLRGKCLGCVKAHRDGDCRTRDCVLQKEILCCGVCADFPCDMILTTPHCTVLDREWMQWQKKCKEDS